MSGNPALEEFEGKIDPLFGFLLDFFICKLVAFLMFLTD